MARSKERIRARKMRMDGESIKKIAKLLNVSVSSVSSWCADIVLSKQQIGALEKRRTDPFYGKKLDYYLRIKKETTDKIENLKEKGIKKVGLLSRREIFLIGIALYWGEGFKKDKQVGLASSDPFIARFFIYWLKTSFDISSHDLIVRVTANESYKDKIRKLEEYWSIVLRIPLTHFSKPFFQKTVWKKVYENKDEYHGVIRIKVRKSIDLLRKIYGFIEGLSRNINY